MRGSEFTRNTTAAKDGSRSAFAHSFDRGVGSPDETAYLSATNPHRES